MSRHSKFLNRKRREEKRLAARTVQIEQQQPSDRLVCSFCQKRPPKFVVVVNPKAQFCTYVVLGEDLDENWQKAGRLMCGERHCFLECFDAWSDFQTEWIAEEQRREVMQQIEDFIHNGKIPEHLLEEDEVATELKET